MEQTDLRPPADLILYNAAVLTFDRQQPQAGFVAIKGNRILAAGNRDDMDLFKGPVTKTVDCGGGAVIPGFNDAHCHPLAFASGLLSVDCSPEVVKNIADIQARIRHQAQQTKAGKWVRATNYDEFHLEDKRSPNRWELDEVSPDFPVILVHATGQKSVFNSRALQIAGISRETPDAAGGKIHRQPDTGEPTGLISGRDERVRRAVPPFDEEDLEQGVKIANREYLSHGVTSIQDVSWTNRLVNWQRWQRLVSREIVSPRVSMLLGTESLDEFQKGGVTMNSGDDRLSIGGLKLALDESTGNANPPQEDINNLALRASEAGFRIVFHVSDIPTLQASLAAIRLVLSRTPGTGHRFRVEHCSVCPPPMVLRLKAIRPMVVTQPSFLYFMGQRYQGQVPSRQLGWLWPIGSFHRNGVSVAFSSDSPLVPVDPFPGIYAAVTRKTRSGQPLAAEEAIPVMEALKMYTLMGAYASLEEEIKGSISQGKLADLVVLSADPTRLAPDELMSVRTLRTIIDGRTVWEA